MMSELEAALSGIGTAEGVEQVLLVGRDGLIVHRVGRTVGDEETTAAVTPGLVAGCTALGRAADAGEFRTAVLEYAGRLSIVLALSRELLLLVLLQPGVPFAPLLREVRQRRDVLASLL
jgi:predicted regulator of Ras-like GTPase activity (Roadblock/LC7/MglB family)